MWYLEGIRFIPDFVYTNFNDVMLAYWTIRVGQSKGNQLRLTCSFATPEERIKLANTITKILSFETKIYENKKVIVIIGLNDIIKLIRPHFHSSQLYRLDTTRKSKF